MYIFFERPVSSGSCQDLNARKIFKRGNVNGKKSRNGEKGGKNTKEGVVVAMSRWLETSYVQSQQTTPLLTGGKVKGIERKESLTLWDEKANATDSGYWIGQHWSLCSAVKDPDVFASCPLISLRFKIRAGRCCLIPPSIEAKFQKQLNKWVKSGLLSPDISDSIRPFGSIRPRLYGLPKIHKDGVPLWPPPFYGGFCPTKGCQLAIISASTCVGIL